MERLKFVYLIEKILKLLQKGKREQVPKSSLQEISLLLSQVSMLSKKIDIENPFVKMAIDDLLGAIIEANSLDMLVLTDYIKETLIKGVESIRVPLYVELYEYFNKEGIDLTSEEMIEYLREIVKVKLIGG